MNSDYNRFSGSLTLPSQSGDSPDPGRSRRLLLLASVVTLALWFIPYSNFLLYPLRLFITFIHESGHALTALATGGSVDYIHIDPTGSGLTMTRESPLWGWLVLSGGYLGTTVFGALLLQVGRLKSRNAGRTTLLIAAGFILAVTLLWFHDPFTLAAGLVIAAILGVLARVLSPRAADFTAGFLAVQCCLNALGDLSILFNLTTNGSAENDAGFMAKAYGLPPTFWAILWAIMALGILFVALRSYWRATASRAPRLHA